MAGLTLPGDVKPGDRVVVTGRIGADGGVVAREISRVRTVITVLRPGRDDAPGAAQAGDYRASGTDSNGRRPSNAQQYLSAPSGNALKAIARRWSNGFQPTA